MDSQNLIVVPPTIKLIGVCGKMGCGKDTIGRIIQFLTQKHNEISLEELLAYPAMEQPPTTEWQIKKFAGKLKECVSLVTGIPLADLEKEDIKNSELPEEWTRRRIDDISDRQIPMTVRQMLQEFGTQGGRAIHPDFWVNALFSNYKPTMTDESKQNLMGYLVKPQQYKKAPVEYKFPHWIITDVRFPNEAAAIMKHNGLIIKVFRNIDEVDEDRGQAYNKTQHVSETALDNYEFKWVINNNADIPALVQNVREVLCQNNIL